MSPIMNYVECSDIEQYKIRTKIIYYCASQPYRFTLSHSISGVSSTIILLLSLVFSWSFPSIRELREVLVGIRRCLNLNEIVQTSSKSIFR